MKALFQSVQKAMGLPELSSESRGRASPTEGVGQALSGESKHPFWLYLGNSPHSSTSSLHTYNDLKQNDMHVLPSLSTYRRTPALCLLSWLWGMTGNRTSQGPVRQTYTQHVFRIRWEKDHTRVEWKRGEASWNRDDWGWVLWKLSAPVGRFPDRMTRVLAPGREESPNFVRAHVCKRLNKYESTRWKK